MTEKLIAAHAADQLTFYGAHAALANAKAFSADSPPPAGSFPGGFRTTAPVPVSSIVMGPSSEIVHTSGLAQCDKNSLRRSMTQATLTSELYVNLGDDG